MVVLGGWLGSGKTTLLNRLLRAVDDGERITVVVNDVGGVCLDAELVTARDGDTLELTNGCVCCSIGDSLGVTLRDLVLSARPPDRLVIEASGVAYGASFAWPLGSEGHRLRVGLYVDPPGDGAPDKVFDYLLNYRVELEEAVGAEPEWERLETNRS